MKAWRIILTASGIALAVFGVFRLGTQIPLPSLIGLAIWLVAALVIHDGLLSPVVVSIGWLLWRWVPSRGRRYLQLALLVSVLITVIAVPLIYLRGSQPAVKAILLRNYGTNLTLIIAAVAVVSLTLYMAQVAQDRRSAAESKG